MLTDRKLIDTIAKFCIVEKLNDQTKDEENEMQYTDYIDVNKLELLRDVLEKLPLIIEKDTNLSSAM